MRLCYNDIANSKEDSIALDACKYAEEVQQRFNQEKQYAAMVDTVLEYVETEQEKEWRGILDQVVEYE